MATISGLMYTTTELKEIAPLLFKNNDFLDAPFLDAIGYGNLSFGSVEKVWSTFEVAAGSQPDEAEDGTPAPQYNTKTRYSNVAQIYARSVEMTFSQLANEMISISGDAATVGQVPGELVPGSEFEHQMNVCMKQIRRDMDFTALNGVYNRPADASSDNRQTRGLLNFISAFASGNVLDAAGTGTQLLTEELIEEAELLRRRGGGGAGALVAHSVQIQKINNVYKAFNDQATWRPADRSTEGRFMKSIITPWGTPLNLVTDDNMPNDQILLADLAQIQPWVKPVPGMGGLFVWEVPSPKRTKVAEAYVECGFTYGVPSAHALITDLDV